MSIDPTEALADDLTELMGIVAVGCPLAAGLSAIVIPLLPRKSAE